MHEMREIAILCLSRNLPAKEMAAVVEKIHEFVPPLKRRLTIIKYITVNWMVRNGFSLRFHCTIDQSFLEEHNEFYFDCDGFPIQILFSEFIATDKPFYRIEFVDDDAFCNSIKILKTSCPLFLKKDVVSKDESLFIRELYINLNTTLVEKMIIMKLQGLPCNGPCSVSGPESFSDINLSLSPLPSTPVPSTSSTDRSRSRSPLNEVPSTPGGSLSDSEH